MKVTKGDKSYEIPNWVLFVGITVLDNIVANACKTLNYKKYCDSVTKVVNEEKES